MVTSGDKEFDKWLSELDEIELKRYPNSKMGSFVGHTGIEHWKGYFEEGLSPEAALDKDNEYD